MRIFYCLVAFAGLLVIDVQGSLAAEKQRSTSEQRIAEALESTSASHKLAVEQDSQSSERTPCLANQDNRNSDLCAQWKAADAAASSAQWSQFATLISAVSGLCVLIALYFTFQSNRIARQSAERQLRAYLVVEGLSDAWVGSILDGGRYLILRPRFINAGQTPALTAQFICGRASGALPMDLAERAWELGEGASVVGPGVGVDAPEIFIPEAEAIEILRGKTNEFVFGVAKYADVFGHERITRFAWQITLMKSRDAELPDLTRWRCVGDHNSAT